MSVHYKFKSNLNYDTVTFDGLHISIADLKKSIMQQKKIGKSSDFDLQITNAQTKEVYDNDETLVAKNTSVIVARVPVVTSNKKSWERADLPLPIDEVESTGHHHFDKLVKNADLVNANASEEDKVKAMISQSSQEYDPSKYVKSRSMTGPLPSTYICYRCGKQGHWIKNCPTNNLDIKRSTGIPRSFMVPVDGPEHKGALLTSSGEYAVPIIDHEAYKEVKKEKPPFLNVTEPEIEPEAEIPEELLCMVCRDLLQDAVLIPCCGNSFCDECVRQVLLESDNHECPLCHETDISPDTVIPNRFLRTAVSNFKNETGYTRTRKNVQSYTLPVPIAVSPQPSPDSTVENQPLLSNPPNEVPSPENVGDASESDSSQQQAPLHFDTADNLEPSIEDMQPGTPLADEPPVDILPQQETSEPIVLEQQYDEVNNYDSAPGFSQYLNENIDSDSRDGLITSTAHNQISTIVTITNSRKCKYPNRPVTQPRHFSTQRTSHHVERPDNYEHDRVDYRDRYDRRNRPERPPRTVQRPHPRYERIPRDSRYRTEIHHDYRDYNDESSRCPELNYDVKSHVEDLSRRHHQRYASPTVSENEHLAAPVPYTNQTIPRPQGPHLSATQSFPPQPPPPGSSPVDNCAQPPPPGVGPLLTSPPILSDQPSTYNAQTFDTDEVKQDTQKAKEMSINDRLDKFARELMEYQRDRQPRNRSRSHDHERSRSRSYGSSKTWSRSRSRTSSRSSRSRSHSSYSSRSRSRSYSHSRSRSRSKSCSYSRSRSRSRSKSRSRSRDRRQFGSRERIRSPIHSNSLSPKIFHVRNRRSPFQIKRNYGSSNYGSPFPPQYGAPALTSVHNFARTHVHPSSHMHSVQSMQQAPNARNLDHFPNDRRYTPYDEQFSNYDSYHQRPFVAQRCDTRNARFDKHGQEYSRQNEDMEQRIPGWVGERRRDYKPRFRQQREYQRRDIPKIVEPEVKPSYIREIKEEPTVKKTDEKQPNKHKKHHHHHHHQTKDVRKQEVQENRIPVVIGSEKRSETPSNLIKVEVISEKLIENKTLIDVDVKPLEKAKEKKHKHKKHKTSEISAKKNKVAKKEKTNTNIASSESDNSKIKSKKKKSKLKNPNEIVKRKTKHVKHVNVTKNEVSEVDPSSNVVFENNDVIECKNDIKPEERTQFDLPVEIKDNSENMISKNLPNEVVDVKTELNEVLEMETQEEYEKDDGPDIPDEVCEANVLADNLSINSADEQNTDDGDEADSSILHVELPAISKWEREEYEEEVVKPQRRSAVVQHKEEKGSLSNEILQRAEKAILQKPLKTAIVSMPSNREKHSKTERNVSVKHEEGSEEKISQPPPVKASSSNNEHAEIKPQSVVRSKTQESPTLQVTISADKDKRSVHEKKKSEAKVFAKEESSHGKRPKLDRSKFLDKTGEANLQRTIVISETDSKYCASRHNDKHKISEKSDRDEKRLEKVNSTFSRQEKDVRPILNRTKELDERYYNNDFPNPKDMKKRKHDSNAEKGGKSIRSETGAGISQSSGATDHHVKKFITEYEGHCKSRKHIANTEKPEMKDKSKHTISKKSRSSSYDSSDNCILKKHHAKSQFQNYNYKGNVNDDRRRINAEKEKLDKEAVRFLRKTEIDRMKERHDNKNALKDHKSPTKRREISQDESIFEPNYDETSESDHSMAGDKTDNYKCHSKGFKRYCELPDNELKHAKHLSVPGSVTMDETIQEKEKSNVDRNSVSSSASSSVHTESDSSDSESVKKISRNKSSDSEHKHKHKKSKHKKHKKHKHKHKRKKSHKSKQRE